MRQWPSVVVGVTGGTTTSLPLVWLSPEHEGPARLVCHWSAPGILKSERKRVEFISFSTVASGPGTLFGTRDVRKAGRREGGRREGDMRRKGQPSGGAAWGPWVLCFV